MKKILPAAIAALALQACAPEVLPDYPSHSTAVTRTYIHNFGFKGLFASESTHTVSTRADMRRDEADFKFSGFVMKHLVGARDGAVIWRADQNKQWRLDPKNKTFVECPLLGCPIVARPTRPAAPESAREEPPQRKPSCPLTLAKNKFTVEALAETKEINGFPAKRYKITWDVALQDKNKKKNTSLVAIDLWTTPENSPRITAVRVVDRAFELRLREKAADGSGLGKVVPAEAMKIIASQFLAGLTSDQRSAVTSFSRELGKIHGLPVATHLEWNLGGDACESHPAAKSEERSSGLDVSSGLSGLVGSLAQRGVQNKADEMADKPVFAFDEELQLMEVSPASDGLFVPPPSYKLVSAPN